MVVTADGSVIATADSDQGDATIKLWQASTGRQFRTLDVHARGVHALAFSGALGV
jgi:WD40 repeat protein